MPFCLPFFSISNLHISISCRFVYLNIFKSILGIGSINLKMYSSNLLPRSCWFLKFVFCSPVTRGDIKNLVIIFFFLYLILIWCFKHSLAHIILMASTFLWCSFVFHSCCSVSVLEEIQGDKGLLYHLCLQLHGRFSVHFYTHWHTGTQTWKPHALFSIPKQDICQSIALGP